jgi:hypothetical protein
MNPSISLVEVIHVCQRMNLSYPSFDAFVHQFCDFIYDCVDVIRGVQVFEHVLFRYLQTFQVLDDSRNLFY